MFAVIDLYVGHMPEYLWVLEINPVGTLVRVWDCPVTLTFDRGFWYSHQAVQAE